MDPNIPADAYRLWETRMTSSPYDFLSMGIIDEIEIAPPDQAGNEDATKFVGYATITRLPDRTTFKHVLLPQPMAGNSDFMGGLPLEKTIVLMGSYSEKNIPVILSYIPYPLDELINKRGSVPDENRVSRFNLEQLFPGEKLIQAAKNFITTASGSPVKEQRPLGRIKWDKDGRIILTSQNSIVTITIGDALGDETSIVNSETNNKVVLRIATKKVDESTGATIDIDDAGNMILEDANNNKVVINENGFEFKTTSLKIGESASEALVLGNVFLTLFNQHTHVDPLSGTTGIPVIPMTELLHLSDLAFTKRKPAV